MYFKDIIGHSETKEHLIKSVKDGHVGHSLMFTGPEGSGSLPLAIAFSAYVLCSNPGENDRCGECKNCKQINGWSHPDMHFSFPVVKSRKVETSAPLYRDFVETLKSNPYITLKGWEISIADENKKSLITSKESEEIIKSLTLKSFSGSHKAMIIWRADKMNASAANKLLKTLEEPSAKTLVILVVNTAEDLLPTIVSRTQVINCGKLYDEDIAKGLSQQYNIDKVSALKYARISDGNYYLAKSLALHKEAPTDYLEMYAIWMRACAVGKIHEALEVCEKISGFSRDQQQYFLEYALQFLHQSILYSYVNKEAARFDDEAAQFAVKFAPFMVKSDLSKFQEVLSHGHYMVERNLNANLLFLKLSRDMIKIFKDTRKDNS